MSGIEHHGPPAQAVPRAPDPLPLAQHGGGAAGDAALEVAERPHGLGADRAVTREAVGALKGPHRQLGRLAETAVDPARRKSEGVEPLLEGRDVLAVLQVAGGVPQDAVSEGPAGPVDRRERLGAHDPVDDQALQLLEGADRTLEGLVEDLCLHTRAAEPGLVGQMGLRQREQPGPHVGHSGPTAAPAEQTVVAVGHRASCGWAHQGWGGHRSERA